MTDFEQLLIVQAHDTTLDQLAHRRATLAARERADALAQAAQTLAKQRQAVEAKLGELRLEQGRLEDKARMLEQKRDHENAKLYSGSVSAIKELQALQDEIASLQRQQNAVEDEVIEYMEKTEPLSAQADVIDEQLAQVVDKHREALAEVDREEAEIDAEMSDQRAQRAESATIVSAELLERYETVRADSGGIGVARFAAGRCEGCHLELSAVEADQLKKAPPDAVVTCGSCGRILVR